MPMSAQEIVRKRDEVLQAISQIRVMRRGTLSQQRYPDRAERKDGKGAVGPYGLWQGTVGGKRFGQRVTGIEAKRVREGIANRHRFEALCEEYVELSCQLALLEGEGEDQEATVKKKPRSQSRRASRSSE